jgi:hypothetical protein
VKKQSKANPTHRAHGPTAPRAKPAKRTQSGWVRRAGLKGGPREKPKPICRAGPGAARIIVQNKANGHRGMNEHKSFKDGRLR